MTYLFFFFFFFFYGGGGGCSYVWMSNGLIYHKTPTYLKIIYASLSTGHVCKGYEKLGCAKIGCTFWLSEKSPSVEIAGGVMNL